MTQSLREQITEAAGKVGALVPINVDGISETLYVRRLSIEERAGLSDVGIKPGRRANVASALNLLALALVNSDRTPFASREDWAAWANDHEEAFTTLALKINTAQGSASKEDTDALGKD